MRKLIAAVSSATLLTAASPATGPKVGLGTSTAAAVNGSLTVSVTVVNRTSLVLSNSPLDLSHYYYAMTVNCQRAGLPAKTAIFSIPNGQQGTLSDIVTGSTCTVQEPPPPVPHGNPGCTIGSAIWRTAYSMQPVLVTGNHTSHIAVTNTLECKSDMSSPAQGGQQ